MTAPLTASRHMAFRFALAAVSAAWWMPAPVSAQPNRPMMPSPPPHIEIQRQNDAIQAQNWRIQQMVSDNNQRMQTSSSGSSGNNAGANPAPNPLQRLDPTVLKLTPRLFIENLVPGGQADLLGLKRGDCLITY